MAVALPFEKHGEIRSELIFENFCPDTAAGIE